MVKREIGFNGFTLLEVMIAMTIFATFIATFVVIQGSNLNDSSMMREEELLARLCQNTLNEIVLNPPKFKESLTLSPDTKSYEGYPNYQYTVVYKRFELPAFSKMQGAQEGESDGSGESQKGSSAIEKRVYEQVKKIVKNAIWQVEVTVTNKETKFNFSLSTWLRNYAAKVKLTY